MQQGLETAHHNMQTEGDKSLDVVAIKLLSINCESCNNHKIRNKQQENRCKITHTVDTSSNDNVMPFNTILISVS